MYKKIVNAFLIIVLISVGCILGAYLVIDPIGTFNMPILNGINNYKVKQGGFLDVFKPYQILSNDVKIAFIGTSRVYVGLKPIVNDVRDENVYNFGFSSLSLANMEKYLDYLYCTQKIEKVYLGLDFFQFSKQWVYFSPTTFSQERLDVLANINNIPIFDKMRYIFAIKENLEAKEILIPTFESSYKRRNEQRKFLRGWDVYRGGSSSISKREYYNTLNSYSKRYSEYKEQDKAFLILGNIYKKAKEKGIELFVFFNPISVDLQVLMSLNGLDSEVEKVKRKVVGIFGTVCDFNFVNDYTLNRQKFFYDASHYNYKFGELIKDCLENKVENEYVHILTSENVELKLNEQRNLKHFWLISNNRYVKFLKDKINFRKKLKDGELKNFIGF